MGETMKTRLSLKRTIWIVSVSAWLFANDSPLTMAQSVGAIGGTIQDATGAVIPGANVTLSNPGMIGGNQQAVTDERGIYQFTRLVPSSTYSVKAELAGFRTVVRQNIVVNADVTVRVDMTLELGQTSDTVTVTGEAPLLDTTAVFNQTVLERQILDKLPTGQDLWSIGRMVPAVVMGKYDVGGSESMAQSTGTIHGSLQTEGAFMIDGTETSNGGTPGTAGGYYDAFAFEEINYQAGNAPAENERGGLVYSMVSRTGTNDFHGYFNFIGTNGRLNSDNITPALRTDLIAAIPIRVLQANPNLSPSAKMKSLYNSAVGFSGPILRDRLWFSATGQLAQLNQLRVGSYNADGTQMVDDNRQHDYSIKLSWQVKPDMQVHYLHRFNTRVALKRTLTQLTTANDFYEARATRIQQLLNPMDQVTWTATLSPRLVLEATVSRFITTQDGDDTQKEVKKGDIARFDSVTNTYTVAQPTYTDARWDSRKYAHSSLSYLAGAHNVKVGYQFTRNSVDSHTYGLSDYPAGLRAVFRNGAPDSVNTYNTPTRTNLFTQDQGVYIQDKWKATRKVTLNLGLRLQKTRGWVPALCQEPTIFVSAKCFDKIKDVPNWLDLAPRFGLIYDIFGDGKTALKLAANRYYIGVYTAHPGRVNPISLTNDTRTWTDRNADGLPQLDELGPSSGFNFGSTNRYNPDLKRPYTNEYSVEIERQLLADFVVSLGFFHRENRRNIGSKNLLVPWATYTPLLVTEKNSGQQLTVYNQAPALRGKFDVLFDNFSELDSHFNGVDLTMRKRLSNRWMVMGGLSYGRNVGDVYGTSDLNNPNFTFRRGVIGNDVPISAKVAGFYELPYGIFLSANVQHFTGFPELDTVIVSSNTVALTQVSQSVAVAPRGTNRLPSVNMADLGARKTFRLGEQLTAEPTVEVFNVTNTNATQGRTTVLGPAFHRVAAIVRGRMVRFGFYLKF
jgi:carboxypeptidase family protein